MFFVTRRRRCVSRHEHLESRETIAGIGFARRSLRRHAAGGRRGTDRSTSGFGNAAAPVVIENPRRQAARETGAPARAARRA